jgi:uncharacterized protein (DUF1778 family)
MPRASQMSVPISKETRELLEKQVKSTGVKKGYLVESALRYHLRAIHELPADALIPARLVLTKKSFEQVVRSLNEPGEPTEALRKLMSSDGD